MEESRRPSSGGREITKSDPKERGTTEGEPEREGGRNGSGTQRPKCRMDRGRKEGRKEGRTEESSLVGRPSLKGSDGIKKRQDL